MKLWVDATNTTIKQDNNSKKKTKNKKHHEKKANNVFEIIHFHYFIKQI